MDENSKSDSKLGADAGFEIHAAHVETTTRQENAEFKMEPPCISAAPATDRGYRG